jgi:hypothetical protein
MNFKEAYAADLENAFFDLDEFGSVHNIDGVDCVVVMTEINADGVRNTFNQKETAVNKVKYALYARDKDLRRKISVNSMITLDGRKCFVNDVSHSDGVYTIVISINAV